jgi:CheY-like chemotaxis protein/anti-sigma regulatory factor (Ser/Thr protein kinase)
MHVHVDDVIASARRMVDHELSHRATVTETLAGTPAVAADPHRLEQVLVNLMLNASQAFEDNQSKRQIQIWTAHPTPGEVVIGVRDTGRGISAENIERIFDPFFSTRPNGRGTGLGLWISRDIVRSFGGQLEFQSELGVGTTVTAVLKVADSQHLKPTDPSKQAPRQLGPIAASCRARVLLVDDEPAVLRGLRRRLSVHDVMTAHSVEEAVQTYRDNPFDIVFCDLMMPDSDGMDFYRILDEMGPEHSRRIVMMTGGVFSDRLQRELAKLPNPCIRKPFNDGDIETLIVESLL